MLLILPKTVSIEAQCARKKKILHSLPYALANGNRTNGAWYTQGQRRLLKVQKRFAWILRTLMPSNAHTLNRLLLYKKAELFPSTPAYNQHEPLAWANPFRTPPGKIQYTIKKIRILLIVRSITVWYYHRRQSECRRNEKVACLPRLRMVSRVKILQSTVWVFWVAAIVMNNRGQCRPCRSGVRWFVCWFFTAVSSHSTTKNDGWENVR